MSSICIDRYRGFIKSLYNFMITSCNILKIDWDESKNSQMHSGLMSDENLFSDGNLCRKLSHVMILVVKVLFFCKF